MMRIHKSKKILKTLFPVTLLLLITACTPVVQPAISPAVQETLDKIAIQDLMIDYYAQLGTGGKGFSDFFVEDSVLDVDGMVARGREEIENLYSAAAQDLPTAGEGTFSMLLTNLRINVNGDSATGDAIWVGLQAETVRSLPVVIEHGRENAEFVKRNGRWYFKNRIITSDSGLSGIFAETYIPR
jgi:ketosteroid isomerase-like protein